MHLNLDETDKLVALLAKKELVRIVKTAGDKYVVTNVSTQEVIPNDSIKYIALKAMHRGYGKLVTYTMGNNPEVLTNIEAIRLPEDSVWGYPVGDGKRFLNGK